MKTQMSQERNRLQCSLFRRTGTCFAIASTTVSIFLLAGGSALCQYWPNRYQTPFFSDGGECSDQRFKDAELSAYRALVEERAAAAEVYKNEVSGIEEDYKRRKLKNNDNYQKQLSLCGNNTNCTLKAKADYDKWIKRAQSVHDGEIYAALGEEKNAVGAAQAKYNAKVNEARQLYCAYTR